MAGPRLAKMAWRNLWRNRRRTLVTLSSIAFGVLLAVIFTGMGDSSYRSMIDLAARMGGGHVTLQHSEYLDTPSLTRSIDDASALRETALASGDVERVVTRVSGATMLATAGKSYGAFFVGIDPAQEDLSTLSILDSIDEGELFHETTGRGIVLGARLAQNLGLRMGKKVVYTLTDKNGEIVTGLARLSGIVETGAPTVDSGLCLLPIDTVREVLSYGPQEATQVAAFLADQRKAPRVARNLSSAMRGDAVAVSWKETMPELSGYISVDRSFNVFFQLIIMVLVAAGIFNTLFVSVMERLREFGILMAIGFSPGRLFTLVMWESLWLGLMGLVAAAALTAWPYHYLNTTGLDMTSMVGTDTEISGVAIEPIVYVDIYPEKLIIIGALALLATLLSGLYPAWRAGNVVPVESIKLV